MVKHFIMINFLGPKMWSLEPWEFCFGVKSQINLLILALILADLELGTLNTVSEKNGAQNFENDHSSA